MIEKSVLLDWQKKVSDFHEKVVGIKIPDQPQLLSPERQKWAMGFLLEEIQEFKTAHEEGSLPDAADALLDLIYVCLGRLLEMGVPVEPTFNEIHSKNMEKIRGRKAREVENDSDAVKPPEWTPPDHTWLNHLSPVLVEACKLRASKTEDYESGSISLGNEITKDDYFPFGILSYAQMIWIKALRIRSLTANLAKASLLGTPFKQNHENLRETLIDSINYSTYAVERIDRDEKLSSTICKAAD